MSNARRLLPCVRAALVVFSTVVAFAATGSAQDLQFEPRRETWQRVPDLFAAMDVHEGKHVADVGAGDGFLTVRLSLAVGPSGKVYAIDTDDTVATRLRKRVGEARMTNVEVITGAEDDPHLPQGLDAAIILNAYHEMKQGVTMLRHIRDSLKPHGALVLCEPISDKPGQTRAQQVEDHVIYTQEIVDDLEQAGFELVERQDSFATNLGGTHFGLVVARRR